MRIHLPVCDCPSGHNSIRTAPITIQAMSPIPNNELDDSNDWRACRNTSLIEYS